MSNLQDTINDLAEGLYHADIIDKKTLRDLTGDDLPILHEFTGEEIQEIRTRQNVSQSR